MLWFMIGVVILSGNEAGIHMKESRYIEVDCDCLVNAEEPPGEGRIILDSSHLPGEWTFARSGVIFLLALISLVLLSTGREAPPK